MQPRKAKSVGALIDAAVRGELTKAQALRLCKECPELVTLALLAAAKRIAEQDTRIAEQDVRIAELQFRVPGTRPSPATPSGMVPIHTSPSDTRSRGPERVILAIGGKDPAKSIGGKHTA